MCKKQTYDLVFSLGAVCFCTHVLRRMNLQLASYPFDWLFGSNLLDRLDMLSNHLEHFIELKDLEYSYTENSIFCDAYYNKSNDLTFNHDFPKGVDVKDSYDEVRQKYDRRIQRLFDNIDKAQKVLVVFIERPNVENSASYEDFALRAEKIRDKYKGKQIDFLYVCPDNQMEIKTYKISEFKKGIIKVTSNYHSPKKEAFDRAPDLHFLRIFLKKYRLKMPWTLRVKRMVLKFFIMRLPHNLKEKLRKKYHV